MAHFLLLLPLLLSMPKVLAEALHLHPPMVLLLQLSMEVGDHRHRRCALDL